MNFLAHIYLSHDDELISIGNFIADAIKGKYYNGYPKEIQRGIKLHREIDYFTDTHPIVSDCLAVLYPTQSKYAPVVIDIFFDYYLAKNWDKYHNTDLNTYTQNFYKTLQKHTNILPPKILGFMDTMIEENLLYNYRKISGMVHVFEGMEKRASFPTNMGEAYIDLVNHYETFEKHFDQYFPLIISHTKEFIKTI